MRALLCLLLGIFALSSRAAATNANWNIAGDPSRVAVNFLSNYDYYPRTWPYLFRAQAATVEALRRDLVLHGKLEDEPILIRLPGAGFTSSKGTRLFLKTVGVLQGDTEETMSRRRYVVEWNDENRPRPDTPEFFDGLLALTLQLPKLNSQKRELEIANVTNLRTEYANQIAQYRNLVQHFAPLWSPDNTHLVFAAWQNGRLDFGLLDVA